jgi:hypothetical protein
MLKLTLALVALTMVYSGWRIRQHRAVLTNARPSRASDEFDGLADYVEQFYGET